MADDPIEKLAVGVAADHQANKRRRKPADEVQPDPAAEGASELREAVAALGDAVETKADQDETGSIVGERAAERFMNIALDASFESGSLVGDVRDTLLDLFKAQPKPWSEILEGDARIIADGLEHVAKIMVRKIVVIVAEDASEMPTIHAKLESYAEKGGLKIALTANGDRDTVLALHDAVGQQVVVRRADVQHYSGERRAVSIDPDQPDLEFANGPIPGPAGDDDLAGEGFGFPDDAQAQA